MARSLIRFANEPEYRRVSALSARYLLSPRRKPGRVHIAGGPFEFCDAASFLSAYEEVFADRIYAFRARTDAPLVLDLGANVGVGVVYFKQLYPKARVVAYEPDPQIFACLERNVRSRGLADVELHRAAVWTETTTLSFEADGADGGHVGRETGERSTRVQAESIRTILERHASIDFLKMDIEGAENQVIPACADLLSRADHVFVEYHGRSTAPQRLHEIVDALAAAGFRVTISNIKSRPAPLLGAPPDEPFEQQLNIFGHRA
jgi:FkbM family methyltransferase